MGCLTTLLDLARAAGITMRVDGDRLILRGPKSAETLAKSILAQKAEVVAWLLARSEIGVVEPSNTPKLRRSVSRESERGSVLPTNEGCFCCGESRWWRSVFGSHLICAGCHPPVRQSVVAEWIPDIEPRVSSLSGG